MLINFICGNFLSFKTEECLSLQTAIPVKEFQDDNVFQVNNCKLLKSAVIYGANASGKSNLLAAMTKMKSLVINSSKNIQQDQPLGIEPFKLCTATLALPSFYRTGCSPV
jgi:AAA15 family ATPase/GTPase